MTDGTALMKRDELVERLNRMFRGDLDRAGWIAAAMCCCPDSPVGKQLGDLLLDATRVELAAAARESQRLNKATLPAALRHELYSAAMRRASS